MPFGVDDYLIATAVMYGAAEIGKLITGLNAAKEAKRINDETYQRLKSTIDTYQAEMEGNLPPGTVKLPELEEFKRVVSNYVPEIAKYTPEATPQQITEAGVSGERQAQKQALQQYGRLAQSGYDPIAAAQQEQALSAGAAQASVARQAALREAAQRGMAGTGLESLAGMGAAEQAGMEGRQAALQAQAEAGQRRLQALGAYGNLAGQMRQQGTQTEQANVGIMNAFNERMARNLNQYNQYVAELQNQANLQNRAEQQRMAEMNVEQANRQKMATFAAQQQAAENLRSARQRIYENKLNAQTGLGRMQGEMAGQQLSKQTAAIGEGLGAASTLGSTVGSAALKSYFDTTKQNPPKQKTTAYNEDDTQYPYSSQA